MYEWAIEVAQDANSEDANAFPAVSVLTLPALGSGGGSGREGKNNSGTPRRRAYRIGLMRPCRVFGRSGFIKALGGHLKCSFNKSEDAPKEFESARNLFGRFREAKTGK